MADGTVQGAIAHGGGAMTKTPKERGPKLRGKVRPPVDPRIVALMNVRAYVEWQLDQLSVSWREDAAKRMEKEGK